MGSTLKHILRLPPDDADIRAIIAEMDTDGARGAAVLGGTILEELVQQLLLTKMTKLSNSERHSLFGPTQPLSSFSAKIDLGYALDCYGKRTKHDLHKIREIRNAFAHARRLIDFDTVEVAQHCASLYCGARLAKGAPREVFISSVKLLSLHLLSKYHPNTPKLPPGYEPMD